MEIEEIYLGILGVLIVAEILLLFVYTQEVYFPEKSGDRYRPTGVLASIGMYTLIGIACTQFISIQIGSDLITPRDLIMVFAGLIGGPVIGIPTAAITAAGTFMIGGPAAGAGAVSCIMSAALGSLLWYSAGKRFPDTWACVAIMVLAMVFNFGITLMMTKGGPLGAISLEALAMVTILNAVAMFNTAYLYNRRIKNEGKW